MENTSVFQRLPAGLHIDLSTNTSKKLDTYIGMQEELVGQLVGITMGFTFTQVDLMKMSLGRQPLIGESLSSASRSRKRGSK